MKRFKLIVFIITISLFAGCGSGNDKKVSLEDFVQLAQKNGFRFKEADHGRQDSTRRSFFVTPGRMDISFEEMQDAKAAQRTQKEYNIDLQMVKKVVAMTEALGRKVGTADDYRRFIGIEPR